FKTFLPKNNLNFSYPSISKKKKKSSAEKYKNGIYLYSFFFEKRKLRERGINCIVGKTFKNIETTVG
ncbi:hypothetical protein NL436_28105, partial [Klebsiella pneumoniae]|nr:hypothetical protein [Klebsiella pneumoniae]